MADTKSRLTRLPIPDPDAKEPLPIVLAKDGGLVLSYRAFVARRDQCVVVAFPGCREHKYAPRAGQELGCFEAAESSWAKAPLRHYVFVFPDTVLECAAEGYSEELVEELGDTVRMMSKRLYR
jgi:hypothetical protein